MEEADELVLEAQIAMCGLTRREYEALAPEAQARVRRTALETNQKYVGPVKRSANRNGGRNARK